MSPYEERLKALRTELAHRNLGGFIVPQADEHLSEYIGAYAQRLAWLTGFRGSAGSAVVLATRAAIFIDGRYTSQVREQVSSDHWSYESSAPQTGVAAWLGEHVPERARIGYDPWLHTNRWTAMVRASLAQRNAQLVAVDTNPVDAVWDGRPKPSDATLTVYPDELAGKSSTAKRKELADCLVAEKADAVVLSALDSIAWTFNIRGRDITHTPVALAYALVHVDATADLFVAPEKLTDAVSQHLGTSVRVHPRRVFAAHLATLSKKKVAVDPERTVAAIFAALEAADTVVVEARDPAVLLKAIKSAAEIAGHKAAQLRDGAALCGFLHWLAREAPKGGLDEMMAARTLREFREETGCLRDLSFATISAAGASAALPHYQPTDGNQRPIETNQIYLVDSGGQYVDGTTDVTRTVIVGTPTAEMKDRFTRVLKGHIALATAVFPVGTRGYQLDTLARRYLWDAGLDYRHGTGHGVGAYLCVHEGPQLINSTMRADEPLLPGMILSNEPGYYKAGDYGIRIENLILVVERGIAGAEHKMLGFETLTFAPIDRALIEMSLLTQKERIWIDAYHADVMRLIGPLLKKPAMDWLSTVTRSLDASTSRKK